MMEEKTVSKHARKYVKKIITVLKNVSDNV